MSHTIYFDCRTNKICFWVLLSFDATTTEIAILVQIFANQFAYKGYRNFFDMVTFWPQNCGFDVE
jgi:hypothetical protein